VIADADIAPIAALIADPTRATILMALADGRALPPSELAAKAGVSRPTVSEHLAKMLDSGLLAVERGGRNRYYRLAGPEIAEALESLAAIAPARPPVSLREANRGEALSRARTCYGHLAGRLGVGIADRLQELGVLVRANGRYDLVPTEAVALERLGIEPGRLPKREGVIAKPCNDWSERRPHVAGPLGVAIADRLFELGWIERLRQPRAVRLTDSGRDGLRGSLGMEPADLD
jgi:DNA-binding transcriptional ArsR family regulator